MLWHAMPPEFNTARLTVGAGSAPMMQAAAGWEALATALQTQSDELAAALAALAASWTGASSERAIAAASPMVVWLSTAAAHARKRGLQATAQAAAHAAAVAATPSLPEIAANHITRGVLVATNFFGINMVPIGLKEADYFVRMWNQAAAAMDGYQAATAVNTLFEPLPPVQPIVVPAAGEAAEAGTISRLEELAATATEPNPWAALAAGFAEKPLPEAGLSRPRMAYLVLTGLAGRPMQSVQQLIQSVSHQVGTGDLGDIGALPGEPNGVDEMAQVGLLGASPLSTHPLAGGSGPSLGAGLMRAESLPGLAGSPARTPLLSQLLDKPLPAVGPAGAVGAAGSSPLGSGAAPLGPAVGGGAAPIAPTGGHSTHPGAARPMPLAPAMLAPPPPGTYLDEPSDEDDW